MSTKISNATSDYLSSVLSSGQDYYRGYDEIRSALSSILPSDQLFWFEQAALINRHANGKHIDADENQSATFILTYSAYSLAMDGLRSDLQQTSNAIARNVISDIFRGGAVPSLDEMLRNDIDAALSEGGQTIGGWGGSFYYWNLEYRQDPSTGQPVTVGDDIVSSPRELEKFVSSAVFATLATELQNSIDGGRSWPEFWQTASSAFGADAPLWIKAEIQRGVSAAKITGELGSSRLFSDPAGIRWHYSAEDDRFFHVASSGSGIAATSMIVFASGATETFLRLRLEARMELQEKGLGNISDTLSLIGRPDLSSALNQLEVVTYSDRNYEPSSEWFKVPSEFVPQGHTQRQDADGSWGLYGPDGDPAATFGSGQIAANGMSIAEFHDTYFGDNPVLLDLNGNGIEITSLGQSTAFFDTTNDGLSNRTAWAGTGDGGLFYDADGDGTISSTKEFIFTEWDPTAQSDFEALRSYFDDDTVGEEGILNANDSKWASFKVMVT